MTKSWIIKKKWDKNTTFQRRSHENQVTRTTATKMIGRMEMKEEEAHKKERRRRRRNEGASTHDTTVFFLSSFCLDVFLWQNEDWKNQDTVQRFTSNVTITCSVLLLSCHFAAHKSLLSFPLFYSLDMSFLILLFARSIIVSRAS